MHFSQILIEFVNNKQFSTVVSPDLFIDIVDTFYEINKYFMIMHTFTARIYI